jgi:hypothetical protein
MAAAHVVKAELPEPEITEKISEKRKRGRPRVEGSDVLIHYMQPDARTRRGRMNRVYLVKALGALKKAPHSDTRWPWLFPGGFALGTVQFPRSTVLYELGRLAVQDPKAARALADKICDGRFSAAETARRIRAWRLDKEILPAARADELSDLIERTIDQYERTHEGVTEAMIADVLSEQLDFMQE